MNEANNDDECTEIRGQIISFQCRKINTNNKIAKFTSKHRGPIGTLELAYCMIRKEYRRSNK